MKYERTPEMASLGLDHVYPEQIEAFRWWPTMGRRGGVTIESAAATVGSLETQVGSMDVMPGDWVVTLDDGLKQVWAHHIFVTAYTLVTPVPEDEHA